MRSPALFLLVVLSACSENLVHSQPPMDHFFFPAGLALAPAAGGNQALLVGSANFDLRYDRELGGTLLSVDPGPYDAANATGGSAGRPGGALVKLGAGAQMGSFAGPVAVVDGRSCPGWSAGAEAYSASRYTGRLYRFPLGADGSVGPCLDAPCQLALEPDLVDPSPLGVACRADATRRSLFVSYLRAPERGLYGANTGWLTEFDLDDPTLPSRTFAVAPGPIGDLAHDALTDRLYVVGRFAGLTAPLSILDLRPCSSSRPDTCPPPAIQTVDLYGALHGAELVGIALSNPQAGRPRRAYLSVRIYDEGYVLATRVRPGCDVGGAIMVVDLEEDLQGRPTGRVRSVVPIGIGAGSIRVLPVRPGLADLVVVPSLGDGSVQLYDDESGAVVRVITVDPATGVPEAGHAPSAVAVEDRGAEARVYVASFRDWTVSVLRVPLADPSSADLLRHPDGTPLRIGSPQP
jgi:hypothetical protein